MNIIKINWSWEEFCGPSGFHPWNKTKSDFGICFEELCLQIPVYFVIAIVSAFYVGYRKDWVVREKIQERVLVLRCFIVLTLVFIPIVEMYVFITNIDYVLYPVDYFVAGSASLAWLVHFGYILALKHRLGSSARGPTVMIFVWSIAMILNMVSLRSKILASLPLATSIASLCCHVLYSFTLIPTSNSRPTYYSPCLVGSQHTHSEYTPLLPHLDEDMLGTAMQGAGCFSKILFSWVNPLFIKGLQNKLNDPEELFDVPAKCRCSYVDAKMDKALIGNVDHYQRYEEVPHEPFISSNYGAIGETIPQSSTPVTPTSRILVRPIRRQNVTLFRALHSCFGFEFYSIGLLKFVADMAAFAGPMLLNKLVIFLQDDSIDMHYGYLYTAGLVTASLTTTMFNAHFNWLMSVVGIKMRGAIISTILRKILSVTSTEMNKTFNVGEITNFMSTDTDRIVNSCPSFHALWSIPFQLVITLLLLYQQVGVSFLAGVAFSIVLIPINKVIANKIGELSTELMKYKDNRVNLITDILKGIRTVKMHVWEDYFIDRVSESRQSELRYLRYRKYLDAICVVLWATTPVMVSLLTLGTHSLRGGQLDAPMVFTTIALINMLIAPLNAFPWVLNGLTEAWVSIKRIQKLLELPDMDPERYYDKLNTNRDEDKILIINNATFSWAKPGVKRKPTDKNNGKGRPNRLSSGDTNEESEHQEPSYSETDYNEPFMLKNINVDIGRDELIGITGPVGSGKTSFLHAILGEMIKKSGSIQLPESIDSFGYVSQTPWLIRGTIRDNILFGKPYDETKFRTVIEACALTEDLNVLGWNASVGDGGCTLSGGQRTRLALARAVYQDKQIYLFDDVLSGVDARVAQHIMNKCILGLLKRTTRLLVSQSTKHLARTQRTLFIHDGTILRQGPPEAVLNDIEEFLPSEDEYLNEEKPLVNTEVDTVDEQLDNVSRNSLVDEQEVMSQGSVAWWVLAMYLRSVGVFLSAAVVISLILMQVSQNFTFLWLTYWVKNRSKNATTVTVETKDIPENTTLLDHIFIAVDDLAHYFINGKDDSIETNVVLAEKPIQFDDSYYLQVYFGLAVVNLLFTVMRAFLFAYGGVKAAMRLHKLLLKIVVKAKVKIFDVTPTGRILNRFSSDTYTVDDTLPFILNILLAQFFSLIGAIAVIVYSIPFLLITMVPLVPVYHWLQKRYRITSRQLKRLQSVTLAPVYTHFGDTLQGSLTIRALNTAPLSLSGGRARVERLLRASLTSAAAAQWLALRLQLGSMIVLGGVALVSVMRGHTDPGLIGLAISYALALTSTVSSLMSAFTETEREMIAVERVGEYISQVEIEKDHGIPPPYGWPTQGVLSFNNVVLKYSERENAPVALNNISFETYPSEKLGVMGRTGAGKSSLVQIILRMTSPTSGNIEIDGVDISKIHLSALRSRISVIPQEPFIFTGSVRENIDPLHMYTNPEIWRALERCGARESIETKGGLMSDASELSRGMKQLICLTRATLQRSKIILIDEATANLDQETERLFLDTFKCSMNTSTVLFIAHRVMCVLDCERVMVLGNGNILELGPPSELLDDPTSHLYKLVHAHEE